MAAEINGREFAEKLAEKLVDPEFVEKLSVALLKPLDLIRLLAGEIDALRVELAELRQQVDALQRESAATR